MTHLTKEFFALATSFLHDHKMRITVGIRLLAISFASCGLLSATTHSPFTP
jgi:hypothetical protein